MIPWEEKVRIGQSCNKSWVEIVPVTGTLPLVMMPSTTSAGVLPVIFESFPRGFTSSDRPLIDQQFALPPCHPSREESDAGSM